MFGLWLGSTTSATEMKDIGVFRRIGARRGWVGMWRWGGGRRGVLGYQEGSDIDWRWLLAGGQRRTCGVCAGAAQSNDFSSKLKSTFFSVASYCTLTLQQWYR